MRVCVGCHGKIRVRPTVGNITAPASIVTINSTTAMEYASSIEADRLNAYGKSQITGTVTTKKLVIRGAASVKDATVSDNVSIKLDAEGEAVTGTLKIAEENVEGQSIAISNGYVNEIDLKTNGAKNDVALKFGKAQVAVASVVENEDDALGKVVPAASEWDGKVIKADVAAFDKYRQATQIWTASQLASLAPTAAVALMNDINLGTTYTWTMPALTQSFNGRSHTITGGKIVAADDNGTGLFSTFSGNQIRNLTFTGATITSAGKSKVGALVGAASSAITIKSVTVNATLAVTGEADNIGGLIGTAAGKATIGQTGEATDVAVTLSALAGRYNLGGLIGSAAGADIKKTTVAITNGITFTPTTKVPGVEDEKDEKAGSIGMYIGNSSADVTIDAVNPAANDKIKGNRATLGFKLNFSGAAPNISYYFGGKYTEIGLLTADKILKVGESTTVTSKSSNNVYEGTGDDKTAIINWAGNGTSGSNVANVTHGIYVTSKAYAATDVK